MSYQQPPQGYPPQQGYPQQPQQPGYPPQQPGYPQAPAGMRGGEMGLPPALLALSALVLLAGVFVRSITGFFEFGSKSWRYIGVIANLLMGLGAMGTAVSLVWAGIREREHHTAVKVTAIAVAGIMILVFSMKMI